VVRLSGTVGRSAGLGSGCVAVSFPACCLRRYGGRLFDDWLHDRWLLSSGGGQAVEIYRCGSIGSQPMARATRMRRASEAPSSLCRTRIAPRDGHAKPAAHPGSLMLQLWAGSVERSYFPPAPGGMISTPIFSSWGSIANASRGDGVCRQPAYGRGYDWRPMIRAVVHGPWLAAWLIDVVSRLGRILVRRSVTLPWVVRFRRLGGRPI
jgi:hypothetical protein